jgi:hypothetical protein
MDIVREERGLDSSEHRIQNHADWKKIACRNLVHGRTSVRSTASSQRLSSDAALTVGTPVSDSTTAEPPVSNIAVTKILVMRPKVMKTPWVAAPYRARMASRNVCALGAFRLSSIAKVAKRMTCTVAPEAYQNGPETPYL